MTHLFTINQRLPLILPLAAQENRAVRTHRRARLRAPRELVVATACIPSVQILLSSREQPSRRPTHATPAPAAPEHAPARAAAEARHPPPAAGRCCRPSAATRLPAIKLSKLTAPCARPGQSTSPKWPVLRPTGPVPATSTLTAPPAARLAAAAAPWLRSPPALLPPPLPSPLERPAAAQPRRSASSPQLLPPAARPQRVEIGVVPQKQRPKSSRCDPGCLLCTWWVMRSAAAPPRCTPTASRSAAAGERRQAARTRSAARAAVALGAAPRRTSLLQLLLASTRRQPAAGSRLSPVCLARALLQRQQAPAHQSRARSRTRPVSERLRLRAVQRSVVARHGRLTTRPKLVLSHANSSAALRLDMCILTLVQGWFLALRRPPPLNISRRRRVRASLMLSGGAGGGPRASPRRVGHILPYPCTKVKMHFPTFWPDSACCGL